MFFKANIRQMFSASYRLDYCSGKNRELSPQIAKIMVLIVCSKAIHFGVGQADYQVLI